MWWAGPAPYPLLWGEAVRCLGIGSLRTRLRAGGVHGAFRPQQVSWAQSLTRPAPSGGVMPLGELATDAVPEPFTPPPSGRGSGCVRHAARNRPMSGVCGLRRLWRSCSLLSQQSCGRRLWGYSPRNRATSPNKSRSKRRRETITLPSAASRSDATVMSNDSNLGMTVDGPPPSLRISTRSRGSKPWDR